MQSRNRRCLLPTAPVVATMPDIPTLLREVEVHERESEAAQKEYLYKVSTTEQELDSHGNTKKTTSLVADSFTVDGIRVNRVTRRNGKDLTMDEQKKEIDRVDKEIDRARDRRRKAEAKAKDVDPNGNQEITVSRFLELGAFTNWPAPSGSTNKTAPSTASKVTQSTTSTSAAACSST